MIDTNSQEYREICFVRTILKKWSRETIVDYLSKQDPEKRERIRALLNEWRGKV